MTVQAPEDLQITIPPIVLEQQNAITAALDLADSWDQDAETLQATAEYTMVHGTSLVADRYAMRAQTLRKHASSLRDALAVPIDVGHTS